MKKLTVLAIALAFILPVSAAAEDERDHHFYLTVAPNTEHTSWALGVNVDENWSVEYYNRDLMNHNMSAQRELHIDDVGTGNDELVDVSEEWDWQGLNVNYTFRSDCNGNQTWIHACNVSPWAGVGVRFIDEEQDMGERSLSVLLHGGLLLDLTETFTVVFTTHYAPSRLTQDVIVVDMDTNERRNSFNRDRVGFGLDFRISF